MCCNLIYISVFLFFHTFPTSVGCVLSPIFEIAICVFQNDFCSLDQSIVEYLKLDARPAAVF